MSSGDLAYWRSRGIRFNPGVETEPASRPTGRPEMLRIAPWPMPVVLGEPQHDGERLVYESLLWDSPEMAGFAAYSMPLPLSATHRLEADFVAMTPHGLALLEVKGGIVRVNSRPGPSVRWAHETRSGRPTGGHVMPAQLYRLAETFDVTAQAMTGVAFGGQIAQMLVFPHTSRGIVDQNLLARLDAPGRDFARIVFAEDLAQHGIWALVADELARPGRGRRFGGAEEVKRLREWIVGELDVQPGPGAPIEIPILDPHRSSLTGFTVAPPREDGEPPLDRQPISIEEVRRRLSFPATAASPRPKPRTGRWLKRAGIGLAVAMAAIYWIGRPPSQQTTAQPSVVPRPAIATAAAPRPSPTPDSFQAALTRAAAEPDRRVAAGGSDWVRVLGPVTGRPGCQLAEMAYGGQTYNVVACRDGERGTWRY